MPVISWLPTGKGGTKEEWIDVTVNGAAYETVTLTESDGTTSECVTDANGKGTAAVKVGETYTLIGGVSGYEKTVTVKSDTESIKVMPEGALYWYGNLCEQNSGGWEFPSVTNTANYYMDTTYNGGTINRTFLENCIQLTSTKTTSSTSVGLASVHSKKAVDFRNYVSLNCIIDKTITGSIASFIEAIYDTKPDQINIGDEHRIGISNVSGQAEKEKMSIDTKSIETSNYVAFATCCFASTYKIEQTATIHACWLE